MIADEGTNTVVAGGSPREYSMHIDEVEKFLIGEK
jgi:hypothetical protein